MKNSYQIILDKIRKKIIQLCEDKAWKGSQKIQYNGFS